MSRDVLLELVSKRYPDASQSGAPNPSCGTLAAGRRDVFPDGRIKPETGSVRGKSEEDLTIVVDQSDVGSGP
ncbi:uncharacterized protein SPSK_10156 [Sporothrix schenckii 1099-18]|uniref:Uncharacterized protein n=1 Tax=Sporothrix schenckii 1099-18 TaxID=1397361 RepID=A0A0F2M453_SPOSC|nr:uncharacterized protein SPSK_10156 [Sporothrix schenckii 1099-18]KJR84473.1 hypothetical protein SPSK_10156 [Sporothrix schenckii 1099-18]